MSRGLGIVQGYRNVQEFKNCPVVKYNSRRSGFPDRHKKCRFYEEKVKTRDRGIGGKNHDNAFTSI